MESNAPGVCRPRARSTKEMRCRQVRQVSASSLWLRGWHLVLAVHMCGQPDHAGVRPADLVGLWSRRAAAGGSTQSAAGADG